MKTFVTTTVLLLLIPHIVMSATMTGEMKVWYPVTLTFAGKQASETEATFRNNRLDVTFTKGGKTCHVPGYFAADGNAAETSATRGNKWRVKFTPDEAGTWRYSVSFRTGSDVAASLSATAGNPGGAPDGETGTFDISSADPNAPGFYGKGMLTYVGEHYAQFKGSKEWFVKAGPGSPEDFFGYEDFDNTRDQGGSQEDDFLDNGLHAYAPHIQHWQDGDPTWQGGKGKGIIGAINYLAGIGANTLYMIIMTVDADSDNCWPWTGPNNRLVYDVSKLDQWDIVWQHMDRKGLNVDLYLSESENNRGMNRGDMGPEYSIYYREIVARFSYHLGWRYNISEEPSMDHDQLKNAAARLAALDPYGHPVGCHCSHKHADHELMYNEMLGLNYWDGAWMQLHHDHHTETIHWIDESANAGHKWIVSDDESWQIEPNDKEGLERAENYSWKIFTAGGEGIDQYPGYGVYGATDVTLEDFSRLYNTLNLMMSGRKLLSLPAVNSHLPSMHAHDDLVGNEGGDDPPFCFARKGSVYVVYSTNGSGIDLDLSGESGTFYVQWWDPRKSDGLKNGSLTQISGGGTRDLGNPPYSAGSSWAALVTAGEPTPTPALTVAPGAPIRIYHDPDEAAIIFAAQDLKRILGKLGTVSTLKPLSDLAGIPASTYFVIAKSNTGLQTQLKAAGGQAVGTLGEQDYALRVTGSEKAKGYWALGGDRVGAMYGGIHIGEIAATGSLADLKNEDKSPYIRKRGLKFNIPLDKRTPSFDDGGASAQTNRANVWDLDFWEEYLDVIARQRFNVLSLWVRHPFPSIVKVPGYEDVALNDGVEGDNGKKINNYTIDQKIAHWRQVLEMAYDRGIECWFVTWNIHTHGTEHTNYGWSQEPEDEPYLDESYKDYLKASVLAYFRTYPRMAGIGITAGENMRDKNGEGLPGDIREQWLWDTYGEAVMQIKKEDPSRNIRFVHRHWLSDYAEIADRFDRLPDGFEFSLKYSQARLYSSTKPPHAYKKLGKIANDKASWWNLRNDDIFIQRWGDPDFVKDFILNFPNEGPGCDRPPCITAGYVMGSDRYFWGRESMSKNPQTPRQLENEKHWYKFLLWGRLGYDPYTSKDLLRGLIQYRFPTVNASKLFDGWQAASRIIPMVNRFHYVSWDYQWWIEKGTGNSYSDIDGYHNIDAIITYKSKDISTLPQNQYIYTSIEDFVKGENYGTSPLVIADSLETDGNAALTAVAEMTGGRNMELKETLGDIRSQAHFGLYWAHKIRGGVELERFRKTKTNEHKDKAIEHLKKALGEWKNYAAQLDASYEKVRFSGHGVFDWDALTSDVENDITIARNAK